MKESGIYVITNKLNNKVYIGKSIDLLKRFKEHKGLLNDNSHFNRHLQNSWNKYGEENFSFEILEKCDENYLSEKEIYYISKYNAMNMDFGYNLTSGGDGSLGFKHTDESKRKISIIQMGRKLSEEHKENIRLGHKGKMPKNIDLLLKLNKESKKVIVQINIKDKSIFFWDGINECARETGLLATNIVKCLKGHHKTCSGYIFLYVEEYDESNIDAVIEERTKIKTFKKGIVQLTLNNEFVKEYDSMKEADEEGFIRQLVRKCCNNKIKSYKGYKWFYKEDYYTL